MKFVNIDVDANGRSYFKDVDLPQTGTAQRISSKNQNVKYWKMGLSQPGHAVDFKPAEDLMFVAVFSGQMNVTVGTGETRAFVRGDMLTMWDTAGQGHRVTFSGLEPCHALYIALPDKGEFKDV
jgi:hypothetical protein